ncbi:MAG TPA: urea ABC transporter permease subunit UrtB [Chthoniobacteraceae bacterium]
MKRKIPRVGCSLFILTIFLCGIFPASGADAPRQVINQAILEEDDEKKLALISSLAGQSDPVIGTLFSAWKEDSIFLHKEGETKIPVQLIGAKDAEDKQAAVRVDDGQALRSPGGEPLRVSAADLDAAEHDSNLRGAMKGVLDLISLSAPNPNERMQAISTLGMAQDAEKLPALLKLEATEKSRRVRRALREAISLIRLKSEDPLEQIAACKELAQLGSIPSRDFLTATAAEANAKKSAAVSASPEAAGSTPAFDPKASVHEAVAKAARDAQVVIAGHIQTVNILGTAFRGVSGGSVLLVVALGLAITFGLMGVINMAHGEVMAVGAYTTYIVQNVFGAGLALSLFNRFNIWLPGLNLGGSAYESFFLVSLPIAFLTAAAVGILLERTVIRFLYRRPLESLLATWGVSLVLQQLFRLIFGANNVQVYSPSYLSGNWTVNDVVLGWNRLFVIGFAIFIIIGTHLILTRTSLGLLIRAVMQNRQMAACMGVKTERVNMLTFGLGSGLAGLAGAFLSQLGNVGPSMGQDHIVNAFMTVVVGGVGNILGTVISALAIGVADQSLQQILLNPVLGKILVLGMIILFLQWRPAGLFVTKSRSLES